MGTPVDLRCLKCSKSFQISRLPPVCECGSALSVSYDLGAIGKIWRLEHLNGPPKSLWRYAPVLPAETNEAVSLSEGWTPLLPVNCLADVVLQIKDEGRNPTQSIADRASSCIVSVAKKLGVRDLTIGSTGNSATALATYCAKAGIDAWVFMPASVSQSHFLLCSAAGAHVKLINGSVEDCRRVAAQRAEQNGWVDATILANTYGIEGLKTIAYEIVEGLEGQVPDVILFPSDSIPLPAIKKAFDEMQVLGWIATLPKLIPVAEKKDIDSALALAQKEGVFVSPECGACIEAVRIMRESGVLDQNESIVICNTASFTASTEKYSTRFFRSNAAEQDKLGGLILPR